MPLVRVIYRSENTMNMAGTRMLVHFNDIVTKARLYNAAHGVCGFLMFDQRRFHQVLEGEEQEINTLFGRISVDQRHSNVTLLERTSISSRNFNDWSMGSFLGDSAIHPLQIKHRLECCTSMEPQQFVDFAFDFLALRTHAA